MTAGLADIAQRTFASEGDVETRLLLPLLELLGFTAELVASKVPVRFVQGTKGHPFEADFVVYSGVPHSRTNLLMVCEAKKPGEDIAGAKAQAESYAVALRAPLYVITNGIDIAVWQYQPAFESDLVLYCTVSDLQANEGRLQALVGKTALIEHCNKLRIKKLTLENIDVSSYLLNILDGDSGNVDVPRTYQDTGPKGNEAGRLSSAEVYAKYERGCFVLGGRGLGKSTIAHLIALHAAALRARGKEAPIPVYVDARDPAASGHGVDPILTRRLVGNSGAGRVLTRA